MTESMDKIRLTAGELDQEVRKMNTKLEKEYN
jgi:hypothetical protein